MVLRETIKVVFKQLSPIWFNVLKSNYERHFYYDNEKGVIDYEFEFIDFEENRESGELEEVIRGHIYKAELKEFAWGGLYDPFIGFQVEYEFVLGDQISKEIICA